MLSCSTISSKMPIDYFAKDGYYTRDNTAHDRWEGTLAKAMGLEGQVTKEQFDAVRKELIENGREKCIAMDCSFSAPKSVSLAMAESKETRDIIQKLHQEAISQSVKYMEENYIKTRVTENGKTHEVKTGNLCAAEFEHYTSRNNDLDLHTHVVIENMTIHNGKLYSIDFRNIMSDQKEIGLIYRQNLAQALQREGYVLEITDHKHGFFELKGFDRETIMEHSTRRQEILNTMSKTGGTTSKDAQDAAMKTRKKKVDFDLETSYEEIKKEIFDSGKIKIERVVQNEHEGNQEPSNERGREEFIAGIATEPSVGIIRGDEGQRLRTLEGRYSLPNLSDRGLDIGLETVFRGKQGLQFRQDGGEGRFHAGDPVEVLAMEEWNGRQARNGQHQGTGGDEAPAAGDDVQRMVHALQFAVAAPVTQSVQAIVQEIGELRLVLRDGLHGLLHQRL